MKKILFILLAASIVSSSYAQKNNNSIDMEFGKGLNISLNGGEQVINIGGYVQLDGQYIDIKGQDSETRFDIRRAYLNIGGKFLNNKLSFFTQFDFADSYPLLDAWLAYHPTEWLTVTAGQKQSLSGPRSMLFKDTSLALGDRSYMDQVFFTSGRELGVFLETRFPLGPVGLEVGGSVTSGDGRNSFGSSSLDYDLGGFKYSGRASFYPLGFFSPGNELTDTDFAREKKLKLAIGGAYSYNVGVSDPIGKGHGNVVMYDKDGKEDYPDYRELSIDLMMKYNGFTFLAEYFNATADGLDGLYTRPATNAQLVPKQIADYLILGDGFNVQAGYLFPSNWAVDVRYSYVKPEWSDKTALINKAESYKAGISKYLIDNRFKVQLAGSYTKFPKLDTANKEFIGELTLHVVF
ncbi:porin [Bacteroides sp. 51]|uniref:porin n=1 Tax=Bacteroides sp. 51 TaxID=2302938 RepID=UPI0013D1993C|nr:porin [Bacteroides sp. 51]NDV80713.1 porin [Bacteroides sp. 51]